MFWIWVVWRSQHWLGPSVKSIQIQRNHIVLCESKVTPTFLFIPLYTLNQSLASLGSWNALVLEKPSCNQFVHLLVLVFHAYYIQSDRAIWINSVTTARIGTLMHCDTECKVLFESIVPCPQITANHRKPFICNSRKKSCLDNSPITVQATKARL